MAGQYGRVLEAEPLPTPPTRLSQAAAAGKCRGRKMVEKGGDSLIQMGRCTGGSCKMMGEGLLTDSCLHGLAMPSHASATMPQLEDTGRTQEHPHPRLWQFLLGTFKTAVLRTRKRSEEAEISFGKRGGEDRIRQRRGEGREGAAKNLKYPQLTACCQWQHVPWSLFHRVHIRNREEYPLHRLRGQTDDVCKAVWSARA